MDIEINRAQKSDAKQLAEVFNLSFFSDYKKYGACPGYNKTEESLLWSIQNYEVYKILAHSKIVGAISVQPQSAGQYYLGALCILPAYANQGIGQQAMRFLDQAYPNATHWALETPADKLRNHYFYKKFGYQVTKEYLDGTVPISFFERQR